SEPIDRAGSKCFQRLVALAVLAGTFSHTIQCPGYTATQQLYAHHSLVHLMVSSVTIWRLDGSTHPITVQLQSLFTLVPEVEGGPRPTVHMLWTPIPQWLTLGGEERERCWQFLTAVAGSEEEAKRCYSAGLSLAAAGSLLRSHIHAWAALRRGSSVELDGPPALRQALHGCLYYLLSALPPLDSPGVPFHGISPGGLSNGTRGEDYWGHVFWDQVKGAVLTWGLGTTSAMEETPSFHRDEGVLEGWSWREHSDASPQPIPPAAPQDTWMFPNILLLHPGAARAILHYRIRTLEGAKRNAREQGYEGAKFPWESAATGREVCPEEIYGAQEIHISGDVLMAFEQRTGAGSWWKPWLSTGVMPPDEYHSQVDNSAYTNAVARRSLNFAAVLARDLLLQAPEEWEDRARKIKVPFDEERKYHPEYDGYSPGEPVKQADVVLLGFPLMHPMSAEVRRNDLEMYEPVTDPAGPAMTWSMFAVGWLELKEPQRAWSQLEKCFSNITEPFKVWVENADGSGAVNFLTGMGGFLQVVLFGFTGFRITRSALLFDPAFPDSVTKLKLSGISYLGNRLEVTITSEEIRMAVTEASWDPPASPLEVVLESGQRFPLWEGAVFALSMFVFVTKPIPDSRILTPAPPAAPCLPHVLLPGLKGLWRLSQCCCTR
ncbi:hypothetical protein EK904_006890, partial [Melospiza melodia maxima]